MARKLQSVGETVVMDSYQCATNGFMNHVRAIERCEKRLRKLERGRRVYGQVVFNHKAISAEKEQLAGLWFFMGELAANANKAISQ